MRSAIFHSLWFIMLCVLSYEYYQLNFDTGHSLLLMAQKHNLIPADYNLSPEPGRPISLNLGWAGITIMVLTNLYIFRKRLSFLHGIGKLANWLDFHIFCGLVGPTFILYHCNFKVRGLVAISFWSMIVSVASGIVGRYLYLQMARVGADYDSDAERLWARVEKSIQNRRLSLSDSQKEKLKLFALSAVGADREPSNPFSALWITLSHDMMMLAGAGGNYPVQLGKNGSMALRYYAINVRRARFIESFKQLMSYWHTFHMPFAVFMYLAAIAHIAAALLLGVYT